MKAQVLITRIAALCLYQTLLSTALSQNAKLPAQANPAASNSNPSIAFPQKSPDVRLSFWATEVVKLAQAGMSDDVVVSFLDNVGTVNLGADQIIYLKNRGISSTVITAMLQHDFELASGLRPLPSLTVPISQPIIVSESQANGANSVTTDRDNSETTAVPAPFPAPATLASAPAEASHSSVGPIEKKQDLAAAPDLLEELIAAAEMDPYPADPASNREDRAGSSGVYAVREPYPVAVTGPIIVIREPSPTPNILLVRHAR